MIIKIFKLFKYSNELLYKKWSHSICVLLFKIHGVNYNSFVALGTPDIIVENGGRIILGENLVIVNNSKYSTLGKSNKCKLIAYNNAKIEIGNKVGMSNCTIIAKEKVIIGNNILIGGGVTITDTDFHSLNSKDWHTINDYKNMKSAPVFIGDNVFIGMDTIILKGVNVGSNVIIGAGSVVTRSIPENQIWAGNPAKFIKQNIL